MSTNGLILGDQTNRSYRKESHRYNQGEHQEEEEIVTPLNLVTVGHLEEIQPRDKPNLYEIRSLKELASRNSHAKKASLDESLGSIDSSDDPQTNLTMLERHNESSGLVELKAVKAKSIERSYTTIWDMPRKAAPIYVKGHSNNQRSLTSQDITLTNQNIGRKSSLSRGVVSEQDD